MRALVLGGTGLLGRALVLEARQRGFEIISAARSNSDHNIDLCEDAALDHLLGALSPDLVINAAAIVNLAACEADPQLAHRLNARPAEVLAHWSSATNTPFVQVSTDHFFDGGGDAKHDEQAPITLLNTYARSKYAGEEYALQSDHALVVRTSLAGFHPDGRGFAHWAMDALHNHKPLTLFDDFYGSIIDVHSFSEALFELLNKDARGLFNLASSDVSSKKGFTLGLANAANIKLDWAQNGSVRGLMPRRARSLGLDVQKAETALGRALPGRDAVCAKLITEWETLS